MRNFYRVYADGMHPHYAYTLNIGILQQAAWFGPRLKAIPGGQALWLLHNNAF